MIRLKQALSAWILATALAPAVATHAATYYVATTGNNTNPGTEDRPWRTIGKAVDTMIAGDTTYVRGGTYNTETTIRFKRSGTASAPIKLLNYPGENPVIDWIDQQSSDQLLVQHGSGQNVAVGYLTIEGFEIKNGWVGFKFYSLHNSIIRKNWIHDNVSQGINGGGGHHNLFDRNIINHNGTFAGCAADPAKCNQSHGIYINGQFYTITNNLIYDNLAYGIQQNGASTAVYTSAKYPSPDFAGANDWLIANNTFAYQNHRSGIVVWGSLTTNTRIENNIFHENSQAVVAANGVRFVGTGAPGVTIRNNHAYATSPGGTVFIEGNAVEGTGYTQSGNVVNISPPGFVNAPATLPASPNFALTARSPAIDKGLPPSDETPSETVRTAFDDALFTARRIDFAGTARPKGRAYDIGAYEYSADGDSRAPLPVQNVQVR
jgi:hypothetical protein